ncbi:MAG: MBL fold metallo-hydrolase [Lachnospiraceae bacterium]|nr:MBL fold metallo-hydrolase [Lachnospiraceae bacterium]
MIVRVVIGSIFGIGVLVALAFVWPMHFMSPLQSGKIDGTDIIAVRNRINNLFFIPSGKNWIVVDAGSDAKAVMQEMERLGIDGKKVTGVFLTHTDYDHVASLPLFPNATIYMSKWEKQMIDGSTRRQLLKKNRLPKSADFNRIVWLTEDDRISIKEHDVRMIWAPGHTKGSAIYVVDEQYVFSGDAFRVVDGDIRVHPYTMDRVQAEQTIQSIKGELQRYEKVFTAHYGIL